MIELVCMGNEIIPANIISTWDTMLKEDDDYKRLADTELHVIQGSQNEQVDQLKYINELYESQKNQLSGKAEKIAFLEAEVTRLQKNASQQKQIPFHDISAEAKANYEDLVSLQYDNAVITDFNKTDTLTIFEVKWKQGLASRKIEAENKRVYEWLKVRLKDTTIQLRGTSK